MVKMTTSSLHGALAVAVAVAALSLGGAATPPDGGTTTKPTDPATRPKGTDGPKPGDPGPAVLVGHVDFRTGPDVFYRLDQLRPGDEILVGRADGTTARFLVGRLERRPRPSYRPAGSGPRRSGPCCA
jgi:hypothetical protein